MDTLGGVRFDIGAVDFDEASTLTWLHSVIVTISGEISESVLAFPCLGVFSDFVCNKDTFQVQGPVVQSWVMANPGLKFDTVF